jgi:DNA-binding transcriptional LysR family regulator
MVEAGLGISIVPLLPSGAVTRGRRVRARALDAPLRPIHSGVLVRRGEKLAASSVRLFDFIRSHFSQ